MRKNIWSERRTKVKIIDLNTSLYLQEDISQLNSRLRTAQVSYLFVTASLFNPLAQEFSLKF